MFVRDYQSLSANPSSEGHRLDDDERSSYNEQTSHQRMDFQMSCTTS